MVMVKTEQQQQQTKPVPIMSSSSSSSSSSRKIKKFKGVRMRTWGSWVSEIRAPNQKTRIWLGSYSTAEAAARAYDAALLCLKGSSATANLNFPISLYSDIPTPNDINMSPKTIQRVAAAAAAASPSTTTTPPSPSISSSPSPSVQSYSPQHQVDHEDAQQCLYEEFNWCNNLDALKYVDDQMFSDDYLLMFDQTAMLDYSYEEAGDIRLWSFC